MDGTSVGNTTTEQDAAKRAAYTQEWLAKAREVLGLSRRCERADRERYSPIGPGRPGTPVFGRIDAFITEGTKAMLWAQEELASMEFDVPDASRLADVLERIVTGLRGEMPRDVEPDSRRGCCGVTLIQRETEDGTDYSCPLCGKDVTE